MKKFGVKSLLMFMAVAMTALVMAGCGGEKKAADAKPQEKYVVAINATFPPFEAVKEGTKDYVGVDIDIANYIAQKLNKKIEFTDMKFASLVPTLQSGRADMIISGISPTAKRQEVISFTKPYYFPMNAIICKKGDDLATLAKLNGKKAGASLGTTYAKSLKDAGGIEVVELDNTPLVVQDILNGRLDAGMFDAAQASVFVKQNDKLEMHIIDSKITLEDTFAIGIPKNSKDKEKLDAILKEMMSNGEMHKILVKHLGEDQTKQYEAIVSKLDIAK